MKKVINLLLATMMIFAMLSASVISASAKNYSGLSGKGTKILPYLINDAEDWDSFVSAVNSDPSHGKGKHFKLTGDIGSDGNEITTYITEFGGVFDGRGKTIWYGGYFSPFKQNDGEIKNIVTRGEQRFVGTGGAVCVQNNGVIDHCINYASLEGGISSGGICGSNSGLIINCINYASIEGISTIGGICGSNDSRIVNCINTGTVTGESCVAGISGSTMLEDGYIDICFNCGLPTAYENHYAITNFINVDYHVLVLSYCNFLSPIDDIECIASNSNDNNNIIKHTGGETRSIDGGVSHMNNAIKSYDNKTGRSLCSWTIGEDGLPALDTSSVSAPAFMQSEGSLPILCIAVVVIIAGIVAAILIVKKNKEKIAVTDIEEITGE